jgi:plastocyanin
VNRVRRVVASAVSAAVISVPVVMGTIGSAGAAVNAQSKSKQKVEVGDNFFKPKDIEVEAGTKVVWTNKGNILHNVLPDKGKAFGTKRLASGDKYSYTFKKPGDYGYYCSFHGSPGSGQFGTVVVTEATTATTTAAP